MTLLEAIYYKKDICKSSVYVVQCMHSNAFSFTIHIHTHAHTMKYQKLGCIRRYGKCVSLQVASVKYTHTLNIVDGGLFKLSGIYPSLTKKYLVYF